MEIENDKIQKFKSKGMSAMGLNLITRLYGVGMNINFYSLQMRDFLQIFYDIERVIFIEKFIHPESYFIANPVDNAYLQNGEGIINLTSEFEQPQIIDVLKLVISYDLTTTIVMFFFLGLLKEINTLEQLSIILKIPYEQIDQLIIEGVNRLDNDVQQKKSIRMSKQQTVSYIVRLNNLLSIANESPLPEGIEVGSSLFDLTILITDIDISEIEKLSIKEKQLLQAFTTSDHLLTYEELCIVLEIQMSFVKQLVKSIIKKLKGIGDYGYTADSKIVTIQEDYVRAKLIDLINIEPGKLNSNLLSSRERQCLQLLFNLKENDTYPSISLIGEKAKLTNNQVLRALRVSYSKLVGPQTGEETSYLNAAGKRLREDSARVILINEYLKPTFRKFFNNEELHALDLLMSNIDRRFKYSNEEIAEKMKWEGEQGLQKVETISLKFLKIYRNKDTLKVDEKAELIKSTHLEVIKILRRHDINAIRKFFIDEEFDIIQKLVEVNKAGAYKSYKLIAKELVIQIHRVRNAARKIVELLSGPKEG